MEFLLLLLDLFIQFFLIGLFTFGGGYAMIPLIEQTVMEKGWMASVAELYEFIGIAEATPGPFAVNISTFIGYNQADILGALCSTLGVVLPSFIIILFIAWLGNKFLKSKIMQNALKGIRPVVIGLIASVCINILFENLFNQEFNIFDFKIDGFDYISLIILGISLVLSFIKFKVNGKRKSISPIIMILLCGVLGVILYSIL